MDLGAEPRADAFDLERRRGFSLQPSAATLMFMAHLPAAMIGLGRAADQCDVRVRHDSRATERLASAA